MTKLEYIPVIGR